jgi:hypothetical protein
MTHSTRLLAPQWLAAVLSCSARRPPPRTKAQRPALWVRGSDIVPAARQKNPADDTRALEREIDQPVYAFYGVTVEERKVVEQAGE